MASPASPGGPVQRAAGLGVCQVPRPRWVGIDQGYSQMGLAVVASDGTVLASARTREPVGDGHARDVALARLGRLLPRVEHLRDVPVRLAGYCYEKSGVCEEFRRSGWLVEGWKALNDVMGVYGLTAMRGHTVVGGCGTFGQLVYVDRDQTVRWPGDDVAARLPEWPLSGRGYANFLVSLAKEAPRAAAPPPDWVRSVDAIVGSASVDDSPQTWSALGPLLGGMLSMPEARAFVSRAVTAVIETHGVLWRCSGADGPPALVLGGGGLSDGRLWALVADDLRRQGVGAERAQGDLAAGLARFAMAHPEADPWAVIGDVRPAWLS